MDDKLLSVWFKNSVGNKRVIGYASNREEAFSVINSFLEEHHFTSYYKRTWDKPDGSMVVDVGSYTEFFYIRKEV